MRAGIAHDLCSEVTIAADSLLARLCAKADCRSNAGGTDSDTRRWKAMHMSISDARSTLKTIESTLHFILRKHYIFHWAVLCVSSSMLFVYTFRLGNMTDMLFCSQFIGTDYCLRWTSTLRQALHNGQSPLSLVLLQGLVEAVPTEKEGFKWLPQVNSDQRIASKRWSSASSGLDSK